MMEKITWYQSTQKEQQKMSQTNSIVAIHHVIERVGSFCTVVWSQHEMVTW